jgi:hypothetical protein
MPRKDEKTRKIYDVGNGLRWRSIRTKCHENRLLLTGIDGNTGRTHKPYSHIKEEEWVKQMKMINRNSPAFRELIAVTIV